ncbi:MAG: GspE/PulE family protein [Planctomycetota bacterium]|nr:GspE/PulE family protein [Planctomycetota bacterium]
MIQRNDFVLSAMLEEGIITQEQLDAASAYAKEQDMTVPRALVAQGVVSHRQIAICMAEIFECPFVDLEAFEINIRNTQLLPQSSAQRLHAFPLFAFDGLVTVGMADPLDLAAVDQLRRMLKAEVDPVLCEQQALSELIARGYSLSAGGMDATTAAVESEAGLVTGEEPVVAAVNQIMAQAAREGASDIHIGPDEHDLHLRFRIDGRLHQRQGPPKSGHSGLVQRLKVMASLDLTQTRRPQDGKFRFTHAGKPIDVRLSLIPTIYGENIVMRLLASGASIKDFQDLGIASDTIEKIESLITKPHGLLLVTGPTGSGKTTTLYTAIKKLNSPDRNVMTIEDPVEIRLPMVRQLQVNSEIGLTFAGALRSILRQDPDVVLVGEIRDEETARIACQAALTGHFVLSTLHTNDAPGAIGRLRDMGCPPFAINAALVGVLAQRLLRSICTSCAAPDTPDEIMLRRFGIEHDPAGLMRGAGCGKCMSSGYRGRIAATELFLMDRAMQVLIEEGGAAATIRKAALDSGMRPMWRDGLEKARMGFTTLEEVARTIAIDAVETTDEPSKKLERAA